METSLHERVTAVFKEPLVHFLLAGLVLFAFFALRGEPVDPENRTITIEEGQVERLAADWAQTWQRPPTQAEIDGLIRQFIKEEILYREGLRLGLDQDDVIVRRRIASKMEFLVSSELENERPNDSTLQEILKRHPERYATGTYYSFDQIYIAEQDEATARAKAELWLAALGRGADWQQLGDSISLPRSAENADRRRLTSEFGEGFATALADVEIGKWSGLIASGFGWHLVRVHKAQARDKPKLADVRQAVENDWRSQTARARQARAYKVLLDSYTIKIAKP